MVCNQQGNPLPLLSEDDYSPKLWSIKKEAEAALMDNFLGRAYGGEIYEWTP